MNDHMDPEVLLRLGQRHLESRLRGLAYRSRSFSGEQVVLMHEFLDEFADTRFDKPEPEVPEP